MKQQITNWSLTWVVDEPLVPVTTDIPNGVAGQPFSFQLEVKGGVPPYEFAEVSVPAGMSVSKDGLFSGTAPAAGQTNVVVSVSDSGT